MAQPLGRGLRAARRSGLTRPEPVRTPDGPRGHPEPRPRARNPGQAAQQASGRTPAPASSSQNSSCRNQAGNELPDLAGGSRLSGTGVRFSEQETEQALDLAGLHPYFLQAAFCMLYESHQMGLSDAARKDFLAEHFRTEAIPHIMAYWDNSGDHEKIVLTAAALLEQTSTYRREFSLADLKKVFSRSELWVERLAKRGLLMPCGARYRLVSSVFGPWILQQIAAEFSEERSYLEWLAENGLAERFTGKHAALREILPKIGARYRQLIITWASDPQTFTAMVGLLRNILALVS